MLINQKYQTLRLSLQMFDCLCCITIGFWFRDAFGDGGSVMLWIFGCACRIFGCDGAGETTAVRPLMIL